MWNSEEFRQFVTAYFVYLQILVNPDQLDPVKALTDATTFVTVHGEILAAWLRPVRAGELLALTQTRQGTGFWACYPPNEPARWYTPLARSGGPTFQADMHKLTDAARALPEYV